MGKVFRATSVLSLFALASCAQAQTRLSTPVIIQRKSTTTAAAGVLVFPNAANIDCVAANYATCDPVTMQNGTNAQGLLVVAQDGTVSLSTESILPIGDNTSNLGSTGASALRWANVNSVVFFAPNGTSTTEGCWVLTFSIGCGASTFAPTFSADRVTGQILSNVLAGSGTRCLQADNSGNIGLYSAGCAPTGVCSAWTGYTPTITASGGGSVTTSTLVANYCNVGSVVYLQIYWVGQISIASAVVTFTAPVSAQSGTFYSPLVSIYEPSGGLTYSGSAVAGGSTSILNYSTANFPSGVNFILMIGGTYQAD